jgi:signal transduction histidine kinase
MNDPGQSGVVLLVDDDVHLLAGLQRALRGQPFDVRVAAGAYEAMSLLQAWGGVDVLITDQHMPGMSGTALLSAVRERFPDTARFMLTGRPDLSIAMEAINGGAIHRFFVKPCDAREVASAIREALHERMIAAAGRLTSGPMLLVDVARRRITHGNAAAATLFGVDPETLRDRGVEEVFVDDGPGAEGAVEAFLAERPPATRRWRARRADASLQDVEVVSHAVADGSGTACLAIRNVSDLSRLEAAVTELQRSEIVGQLAGGVAHDLGNLLTVIGGRSALLAERQDNNDAVKRAVDAIQTTAKRGSSLTKQLMGYLRGGQSPPVVIDVNAIMTGAADLLQRIVDPLISITIDLDPSAGRVRGDLTQIEQVIMNLALNARDAMPQGGRLRLRTANADGPLADGTPPGRYVAFEVTDTGVGMAADQCRQAFEPFFTTKAKGKGTGLGLPTVARIVRMHSGHIALQSEPNLGTTFTVYLPRTDAGG